LTFDEEVWRGRGRGTERRRGREADTVQRAVGLLSEKEVGEERSG